jgi:paraquat-inducible protein B
MKRHALLIGSFIAAAAVLVVAGILWLSGGRFFERHDEAVVYFPGGVRGLYVGAPVTFRGVPVGEVQSIGVEMDPKTLRTRIPVQLVLRPDAIRLQDPDASPPSLPQLVQQGLRARLVAQSLVTGQKLVDLDFLPDTQGHLAAGGGSRRLPEIPTARNQFDALIDQAADLPVRDIVAEMRAAVGTLQQTLTTANQLLASSQGEVKATGDAARQMLAVSQQAVQEVQRNTTATLASLQQLSEQARQTVAATQPELAATLGSARQAAAAAETALREVQDVAAPGGAVRADLETSLRDLSAAARSLRDWSELVSERPNAVIFGRERP